VLLKRIKIMAKSVTRWENAAHDAIDTAIQSALAPYVVDGLVSVPGETIYGPDGGIPEGQYECHRTWVTVELAQNWIDTVDNIAIVMGFTSTYKAVIE
jgi:hypothetical protein